MADQSMMFYQQSPDFERNRELARALMQQASAQPVTSPLGGLAKMGSMWAAGWMERQAKDKEEGRRQEFNQTLARALQAGNPWINPDTGQPAPNTGGMEGMLAVLGQSDATAPLATQLQLGRIASQQEMADKAELERLKAQLNPDVDATNLRLPDGRIVAGTTRNGIPYIGGKPAPEGVQIVGSMPGGTKTVTTAEGVFVLNPDGTKGARIGAPATSSTNITLDKGPGAYGELRGKNDAERSTAIYQAGDAAFGRQLTVDQMASLAQSPELQTGNLAPAVTWLQGVSEDLGFDLTEAARRANVNMGNLSSKEEFARLSNGLALDVAERMKGNLSNQDVQFIKNSVAGLGRSEDANLRALAAMQVVNELEMAQADMLRERESQFGVNQKTFLEFDRDWRRQTREMDIPARIKERYREMKAARAAAPAAGARAPADMSDEELLRALGAQPPQVTTPVPPGIQQRMR